MSGPIRARMTARATDEPHRTSSELELLFDLTFVVAIASVAGELADGIEHGHALDRLVPYLQVFFAIWWAWMNFTWFASSYDVDDVPYRLVTLVHMAGVLVLAAGVPAAFEHGDYGAITLGYLIMRTGLVVQWVRVAVEDPASRPTARRYAAAITGLEVLWLARQALAQEGILPAGSLTPVFLALVALELAVPWWAERTRATHWHPDHIAERFGLFTIVLLGESVFAASEGVAGALDARGVSGSLVLIAGAALVLLFALWWLYFLEPARTSLARRRERSYVWGYGHYGIFAGLAAIGAGLRVAVEQSGGHLAMAPAAVAYAVAVPVAAVLVLLWAVHAPFPALVVRPEVFVVAAGIVLALPVGTGVAGLGVVVAAIAAVCATAVAATIGTWRRERDWYADVPSPVH